MLTQQLSVYYYTRSFKDFSNSLNTILVHFIHIILSDQNLRKSLCNNIQVDTCNFDIFEVQSLNSNADPKLLLVASVGTPVCMYPNLE
jgi:hypothetical protein